MGLADKIIRILIAAVVVILYLTNVITGTLAIVLIILSEINIAFFKNNAFLRFFFDFFRVNGEIKQV